MAKTQAERAKEYRQKKRDVQDKMRDAVTAKCDENVTESKRDAPFVTVGGFPLPVGILAALPALGDLPPDVHAEIEKHCSENNNGARSASHSRAAMTERAIHYQRVCGKPRPRPTGSCLTCGGPVQHPSIVKCLKCCTGASLPGAVAAVKPEPDGPLSVYSPARWAYLQGKEYVWDDDRQIAVRKDGNIGVAVPGDPGYVVEAVA